MAKSDLPAAIERLGVLLNNIESLPDEALRQDVQEIVQCLLDYHGAAVGRLLHLAASGGGQAPDGSGQAGVVGQASGIVARLAQDELVGSLLLLHGLHPDDLATRVAAGLTHARPFLESHGGDVELVTVENNIVHLRLHGSCHGCPSSAATLKQRIEQAIYEAAPEIEAVRVEEEADSAPPSHGFVAVETLALS